MTVTGGVDPSLQERQEGDGSEVHRGDVGVEDTVPTLKVLVLP